MKLGKRTYLLLVLMLLLHQLLLAQRREATGYFVSTFGDTTKVVFLVPHYLFDKDSIDYLDLQSKVKCKFKDGSTQVYWPEGSISSFHFKYNNAEVDMFKVQFDDKRCFFLAQLIEGKMSLYKWYKPNLSGSGGFMGSGGSTGVPGVIANTPNYFPSDQGNIEFYVVQKQNEPAYKVKKLGFKKSVKKHFGDCPYVINYFEEGTSTYEKVDILVNYYNRFCGSGS